MRVCLLRSRPSWTAGCAEGPRILIFLQGFSMQPAIQDGGLCRGVSSASMPTVQSAVLDGGLRRGTLNTNLLTGTQYAARRPRRPTAQRSVECEYAHCAVGRLGRRIAQIDLGY